MHIVFNKSQHGKKIYNSVLLRESYRENGKVKKLTIANLSACSDEEVAAIRLALQNKNILESLINVDKNNDAKLGDCDNSGTVTIAEVQSSIKMFLGLKTVEACVDQDNNNSVSITEVQKVINSFLGL